MKKDIDILVENFFAPKSAKLNFGALYELIEEQMENFPELLNGLNEVAVPCSHDAAAHDDISDMLPTLKITEDWGKLNRKDREVIEKFTASLGGETTTIQEKLAHINTIVSGQKEVASINEILSVMMVTEILSSILTQFTESAGGFIFEGFIAGLFGGQSIQITKPEDIEGMDASGKPITDVVLAGRHYSLKLLGPETIVKGSFRNMVDHFKTVDHVTYLDARREGSHLAFSEFDITLPTFLQVFYEPFAKLVKKSYEVKTVKVLRNRVGEKGDQIYQVKTSTRLNLKTVFKRGEELEQLLSLSDKELSAYAPFIISWSEESFMKSDKAKWLFGNARIFNEVREAIEGGDEAEIFDALHQTPAYAMSRQFKFQPSQVEKIKSFRNIGKLELGEDALKKTWINYGERLKLTITPVYRFLNSFTRNINSYFLSAPAEKNKSRSGYATCAINDATGLKDSTNQAVEAMEKEH